MQHDWIVFPIKERQILLNEILQYLSRWVNFIHQLNLKDFDWKEENIFKQKDTIHFNINRSGCNFRLLGFFRPFVSSNSNLWEL
jgi:hypothetical protein